jgi:hypothetical protein
MLHVFVHMMRFTAIPKIQLNQGMRDIGDYRWAKSTHPQRMPVDISPIPLVPGFNRVSRVAVKRI